jgi:hypothetical protein
MAADSEVADRKPPQRPLIKGKITTNGIIDGLEVAGIKCAIQPDKKTKVIVNEVHIGTPAYYAGITAGDTIINIAPLDGGIQLTFERSGKTFEAFVRSEKASKMLSTSANDFNLLASAKNSALNRQVPQKAIALSSGTKSLSSGATKTQTNTKIGDDKLLAYNIEFIVDISRSMGHEDGTDGLSKFEWCRNQVTALADRLAPYARTVNITVFNERYQTAESCNRQALLAIYQSVRLNGSTDLVDPLMARCRLNPGGIRSQATRNLRSDAKSCCAS